MSNTQTLDLVSLNLKDLYLLLVQHKRDLLVLRFQRVLGELANTSKFKDVRHSIARVKTEINRRKGVINA